MQIFEIAITILLPSTFALVLITCVIIYLLNRRYQNYLVNEKNSVRSFIIDRRNRMVRFFNRTNMRKIRILTFEQFFEQFPKEKIAKLERWIDDLLKKDSKAEQYFEIEVFMNRTRRRYSSILKVVQVNRDKKMLHIDSYLFLRLNTRTKRGYRLKDISYAEAIKRLAVLPSEGATIDFLFTFVDKNHTKMLTNKLLFNQLKEIALTYAYPPNHYVISISSSEFVILDLKTPSEDGPLRLATTILSAMNRFLEVSSQTFVASIAVGLVRNEYFPHNLMKLIEVAQDMATTAANKHMPIMIYTKKTSQQIAADNKYASEIEHILKDGSLQYSFTCVYDVRNEYVLGYLSHVSTNNLSMYSIPELYARAIKTAETKKLLAAIVKDTVAAFTERNKDSTKILFRDLKFVDAEYFIQLVSKYNDLRIVPCFDEYDISYYISGNKDFYTIIKKLKDSGISPCLKLSDKSLILDQKIYEVFDYFIVFLAKDRFKRNDSSIHDYRIIVEKLLRYNKPIIVSRAEPWSTVELLIRSGIEYVSGNALAPISKDLTSPTSKNILKIRKMLE